MIPRQLRSAVERMLLKKQLAEARRAFDRLTERKSAEPGRPNLSMSSEESTRQIIETIEAAIVIFNPKGRVQFVNEKTLHLLGMPRTRVEGMAYDDPAWNFVDEDLSLMPTDQYPVARTIRTGRPVTNQVVGLRGADREEPHWLLSSCCPVFSEETGQLVRLVSTAVDITERTRIERAIESANRAKSTFLASMSHEIRTPLNAILGYAQLMQRDPGLEATYQNYLDIINRSGEHLLAIIDEILEMSKIESGAISLQLQIVDFRALLVDLGHMFRVRTLEKQLGFHLTLEEPLPAFIYTDPNRMRQVVINMLSNAVKFTEHGSVTLRAQLLGEQDDMARVAIEVQDTGIGIDAAEHAVVFEPFGQTHRDQTHSDGAGLGMAISQRIAKMLGGGITVQSAAGQGSTFRFEFEARVVKEAPKSPVSPERLIVSVAPGHPTQKILVVEDNRVNRELLTKMLTTGGLEVRTATDGQQGIEVFKQWQPDCILMDVMMPGMDGKEATRRIKATEAGARTPVIIVSASVLAEDQRAALEAGADGFLRKPFRKQELFGALRLVLDIEYQYQSGPTPTVLPPDRSMPPVQVNPASLAGLPEQLCEEIQTATYSGDMAALHEILDKVRMIDPKLGDALEELANRYDYDTLLGLFNTED